MSAVLRTVHNPADLRLLDADGLNSLADQAGLKRFDILLGFDGTTLPSERDLRMVVEDAFKKEKFPIDLIRDGKRQTLTVRPKR